MLEMFDSSQEIFSDMPMFHALPDVETTVFALYEKWNGITGREVVSLAVYRLALGGHTATHVDALNHTAHQCCGQSIELKDGTHQMS